METPDRPKPRYAFFFVAILLVGMLSAADISITFEKEYEKKHYTVMDFFVLENNEQGYATVPLNSDDTLQTLRGAGTGWSKFPKIVTLAKTKASTGRVFIQIRTQKDQTWFQSRPTRLSALTFPTDFDPSNAGFALFRMPERSVPVPPNTALNVYPAIGWAFTYHPPVKVIAGVQPHIYDTSAFEALATAVKLSGQKPPQQVVTESIGSVRNNLDRSLPKNVFYINAKESIQNLLDGESEEVIWKAHGENNRAVPNGDYSLIISMYHQDNRDPPQWDPKTDRFLSQPVHVAGNAKQVGQYLIRKGERFQFQDYQFTLTDTGAKASVRVEQIEPLPQGTHAVDVSNHPTIELGVSIVDYGRTYPDLESAQSLKIRFRIDAFSEQKIPASLTSDRTLQEFFKKEYKNYAILTAVQTDILPNRAAPEYATPTTESRDKTTTSKPKQDKEKTDTEKDVEVKIYTRAESAQKTTGDQNDVFVRLVEKTKKVGVRFYVNIDLQKQGQRPTRVLTNAVIGTGKTQTIPVLSRPNPGTYTISVRVSPDTSVSTPVETTRTIQVTKATTTTPSAPVSPPQGSQAALRAACAGEPFDYLVTKVYTAESYRSSGDPINYQITPAVQKGTCKSKCASGEIEAVNSQGKCTGGICCSPGRTQNLEYKLQRNNVEPNQVGYCNSKPAQNSKNLCENQDGKSNPYCIWEEKKNCVPSQAGYRLIQSEIQRWMGDNGIARKTPGTDGVADAIFDTSIQLAAQNHCDDLNGYPESCPGNRNFAQTIGYYNLAGAQKSVAVAFNPIAICEVKITGRCSSKVVGPFELPEPIK